jgi:hypothetical protein
MRKKSIISTNMRKKSILSTNMRKKSILSTNMRKKSILSTNMREKSCEQIKLQKAYKMLDMFEHICTLLMTKRLLFQHLHYGFIIENTDELKYSWIL